MGYLLKEALKTLCGVNQWSYAVFWKIGCQNPKLLIWEECYYEASSDYNASWVSAETRNLQSDIQTRSKVHFLVNKMMMENHVNIVGEGLVGRVAFTGNHQWILSEDYFRESHPPEVLKEVCQQFSAGMQTIAVIPVLPHGVVQFGSFLPIMRNMEFINNVTSLVLQLGYVSGLMLPDTYTTKDHSHGCSSLESNVVNAPCFFDNLNYATTVDSQTSFPFAMQPNGEAFQASNHLMHGGGAKAEVIPSNSEIWTNQQSSPYIPKPTLDIPSSSSSKNQQGLFGNLKPTSRGNISSKHPDSNELKNVIFTQYNEHLNMAELIPGFSDDEGKLKHEKGDDLFDVLGADFKNKLFSSCWNNNNHDNNDNNNSSLSKESAPNWDNKHIFPSKKNLASSEMYSTNSESGIFSSGTDNLLEAVVSKVKNPSGNQSAEDNVSCRTTVTNMSTSSEPNNSSLLYGRFGVSELFGVPKYGAKAAPASLKTGVSKEESRSFSNGSSIYGSQISSWIESEQKPKTSNSISTGYSKKPEETGKTNRKRLKPGENPRPRPKDRQMIQDRVKELREIVPNGAKCSIDALLERTIKHMLFLQSVTKHADKLKQTGESKIISKDGGLLLKDNFEGGATWAYEVGSQSMVCPIIVEDLNQPRQMLVEMLCEERGLFLEIADIIRGLGLTILKGVMETRNDKIWARFSVEANRDVTRMEIFISLVRLLDQTTAKNGGPQTNNGISNENVMAQQFHQVTNQ